MLHIDCRRRHQPPPPPRRYLNRSGTRRRCRRQPYHRVRTCPPSMTLELGLDHVGPKTAAVPGIYEMAELNHLIPSSPHRPPRTVSQHHRHPLDYPRRNIRRPHTNFDIKIQFFLSFHNLSYKYNNFLFFSPLSQIVSVCLFKVQEHIENDRHLLQQYYG